MKGLTLLLVMCAVSTHFHLADSMDTTAAQTATCSLKENCNIEENILSAAGESSDQTSSSKLEKRITSLFEDKVNYSLKLFAEETIIEYNSLERNLSNMAANFTLKQIELETNSQEDDIEKKEKGKLRQKKGEK